MSAVVFLRAVNVGGTNRCQPALIAKQLAKSAGWRSEEHTSELQSQSNLVCRLLLEKKKKFGNKTNPLFYRRKHKLNKGPIPFSIPRFSYTHMTTAVLPIHALSPRHQETSSPFWHI